MRNSLEYLCEEVCIQAIAIRLASHEIDLPIAHFEDAANADEMPLISVQAELGDEITRKNNVPLMEVAVTLRLTAPLKTGDDPAAYDALYAEIRDSIVEFDAAGIPMLSPTAAERAFEVFTVVTAPDGKMTFGDDRREYEGVVQLKAMGRV